jgi:glycosyltransferase involved in cell wall biosynthesis
MRVAIVHDWLVTYAGSERVLEQLLAIYPQADVFSLIDFVPAEQRGFLCGKNVRTSFLQKMPLARQGYRAMLPLMPLAIEQFDLSGYDLVISSSHCVAKGVIIGPDQLHVSYVHTPARYAWDAQSEYLGSGLGLNPMRWLAQHSLHKFRQWDVRSANGVDSFVANSQFIARRIQKTYRRPATVIYPPVDTDAFSARPDREDFYLCVSRLVPYKRVDLLVQAFAEQPKRRLVVIGDGPQLKSLRRQATPNVSLLGYQNFEVLRSHLERAKAFVFAGREDFGIGLAEAQAAGCPLVAYGRGGAAEIVRGLEHERPTGVLFDEQTPAAVVAAVRQFEQQSGQIQAAACRMNAERFSEAGFRQEFRQHVRDAWEEFAAQNTAPQTSEPATLSRQRVAA